MSLPQGVELTTVRHDTSLRVRGPFKPFIAHIEGFSEEYNYVRTFIGQRVYGDDAFSDGQIGGPMIQISANFHRSDPALPWLLDIRAAFRFFAVLYRNTLGALCLEIIEEATLRSLLQAKETAEGRAIVNSHRSEAREACERRVRDLNRRSDQIGVELMTTERVPSGRRAGLLAERRATIESLCAETARLHTLQDMTDSLRIDSRQALERWYNDMIADTDRLARENAVAIRAETQRLQHERAAQLAQLQRNEWDGPWDVAVQQPAVLPRGRPKKTATPKLPPVLQLKHKRKINFED